MVISGAGPVGLRAAVEAALMGMRVHVIEKRDVFSRVNILMLWQGTADDLVAYGAKVFYPKFTNRHMGTCGVCCSARVSLSLCCLSLQHPTNHHRASHLSSCHICHHNNAGTSPLHLGTREIQLVYLKNALLLGVTFRCLLLLSLSLSLPLSLSLSLSLVPSHTSITFTTSHPPPSLPPRRSPSAMAASSSRYSRPARTRPTAAGTQIPTQQHRSIGIPLTHPLPPSLLHTTGTRGRCRPRPHRRIRPPAASSTSSRTSRRTIPRGSAGKCNQIQSRSSIRPSRRPRTCRRRPTAPP